jgi:F-box domain
LTTSSIIPHGPLLVWTVIQRTSLVSRLGTFPVSKGMCSKNVGNVRPPWHRPLSTTHHTCTAILNRTNIVVHTQPSLLRQAMPPSPIPYDLIEHIIGFIDHDDSYITSLRACSLVCHTWSPIAQACIFRNVTVGDRLVPSFVDLGTSSPHILPYVRCLALTGDSVSWFTTADIEMDPALGFTAIDQAFTKICTDRLPMLDVLRLDNVCTLYRPLSTGRCSQLAFISKFRTITTLYLEHMSSGALRDLLLLLASMPHVKHLHLNDIRIGDRNYGEDAVELPDTQTHPGLQTLACRSIFPDLHSVTAAQFESLPIRVLILPIRVSPSFDAILTTAFLLRYGHDVECLSLCLCSMAIGMSSVSPSLLLFPDGSVYQTQNRRPA